MAGYFDLGRDQRTVAVAPSEGGLESTGDEPAAAPEGAGAGAGAAPAGPTIGQQLLQYLALVLGIVVQPWLSTFAAGGAATTDVHAMLWRVPVGLVMGLVLFPSVYRGAFDPTKPFLVQFGTVMVSGLGWQSAFSSAIGVVSGS